MFVIPKTNNQNFTLTANLANGLNKIGNEKVSIYTANQPRLTINSIGNVGIGTTNPDSNYKLHINGDLKLNGSIYATGDVFNIDSTTLTVDDPIIRLADNNVDDSLDIGFYGLYVDTGVTKYRGLIHDTSDNAWKLFDNETTEPTTTATFSNTPLLTVTNTGNIGIGTNNPSDDLHLYSTSNQGLLISNGGGLKISDDTGNPQLIINTDRGNSWENMIMNSWANSSNSGFNCGTSRNDGSAFTVYSGIPTSDGLPNGDGTTRFKVLGDGNVGIGITNPSNKLHIYDIGEAIVHCEHGTALVGTLAAGVDITAAATLRGRGIRFNTRDNTNQKWLIGNKYNSSLDNLNILYTSTGEGTNMVNYSEFVTVDTSGNVGIGTTNPTNKLHVYGSGNVISQIESIDDNALLRLNSNSSGTGTSANRESRIIFQEESITKATMGYDPDLGGFGVGMGTDGSLVPDDFFISDAGNVGIGTTNPTSKFQVEGTSAVGHFLHGDINTNETIFYIGGGTGNQKKTAIITDPLGSFGRNKLMFCQNAVGDTSNATSADAAMSITFDGNVGIGTTSPTIDGVANKLAVYNNGGSSANTDVFFHSAGTSDSDMNFYLGTASTSAESQMIFTNLGTAKHSKFIYGGGLLSVSTNVDNTDYNGVSGGNQNVMVWDASGNVGIGTNGPSTKLEVSGTGSGTFLQITQTQDDQDLVALRMIGTRGTDRTWEHRIGTGSGESIYRIRDVTANADRLVISELGNVGIGKTNPGVPLDLQRGSTGTVARLLTDSTGACNFIFGNNTLTGDAAILTNNYVSSNNSTNRLQFGFIGNESLMVLQNSGNLGIGTTNPGEKLHIYDTITNLLVEATNNASGDLTNSIDLLNSWQRKSGFRMIDSNLTSRMWLIGKDYIGGSSNTSLSFLYSSDSGSTYSEYMKITNSGNVGIGTNPAYQLELSTDSAAKPTTNTWTISSDKRLKENIEIADYDQSYNDIKNLDMKYYKWKDEYISEHNVQDTHKIGWIADDVEIIYPNAITTYEVGISSAEYKITGTTGPFKSLNTDLIYAGMFGALKKSITKIEQLEQDKIDLQQQIVDMGVTITYLLTQH